MQPRVVAFLRSAIVFDGLTRGEVFSRLFFWWFGPSFIALIVDFVVKSSISRDPLISLAGPALTAVVAWHDARRAELSNPVFLALVAGAIPLVGWFYYARARAPQVVLPSTVGLLVPPNRSSALRRLIDPFASERIVLLTQLSPGECAERLRRIKVSLLAPSSWFTLNRDRPVHGRVSANGFALKRRHPLTRESMITQASGRYEDRGGSTLIRLRLGLSVIDRLFTFVWLSFAALFIVLFSSSGSDSFQGNLVFQVFPVLIFVGVYALVRFISLDDDAFLYRLLLGTFEAEDVTEREPA